MIAGKIQRPSVPRWHFAGGLDTHLDRHEHSQDTEHHLHGGPSWALSQPHPVCPPPCFCHFKNVIYVGLPGGSLWDWLSLLTVILGDFSQHPWPRCIRGPGVSVAQVRPWCGWTSESHCLPVAGHLLCFGFWAVWMSCYEHSCAFLCVNTFPFLWGENVQEWGPWLGGGFVDEKWLRWPRCLTFPPAAPEDPVSPSTLAYF